MFIIISVTKLLYQLGYIGLTTMEFLCYNHKCNKAFMGVVTLD